ncbi:MAG: two-component regulator propeller domain-containing protein [Melioribacteraceae bacterium]
MKKVIIICLFCLSHNFAWAQIKIHKSILIEDGLIQGEVTALFQDSKDFIWIGTLGGLSIWDGNNFKNFNVYNGLPASQIMDIKESPNGTIYLAVYGGGIIKISNGKFDTINVEDGLLDNNVTRILILAENKILFLGNGGKISQLENGKISDFSSKINFPKTDIWDVHHSESGIIYCATSNGLITIKNNLCKILTSKNGLSSDLLWSVNSIGDSIIYVGTNLSAHKIINGKIITLKKNIAVYKIHISKNGKTYFATNDGILIEQNGNLKEIKTENGLLNNDIWTLTEDKNGLLYFGTNGGGVSIYNPKEYLVNYNSSFGFIDEKILSITQDNFGNQLLGTKSGLYKLHDFKIQSFVKAEDERGSLINVLYKKKNGEILVGTYHGLKIFKNNSLTNYGNDPQIINNEIYSIAEADNNIFVGTYSGVYFIKEKQVSKISYYDKIESNFIISILPIDSNKIYFGSFDKGIFFKNGNEFTNLTKKNGLSENVINCLLKRNDGSILIGTQNGLNILKNNIVVDTIDMSDGLSNNAVVAISEDQKGRIFVSTNKGINIILNTNSSNQFIKNLTQKEGLVYDNCLKSSMFIDNSGNLLIGTSRGLSVYNPEKDLINKIPPKIYLTGLEIFGKDFPISEFSKNRELNYNQNYLKFIFTGINLTAPNKILYKYRLSGINDNWVSGIDDNVQYTNLDDGKYKFEVKAQNEWGYLSEPVSLEFTIKPAWWETWWFRLIIISSFGFILWLAFQYRLNYLLKLERLRIKIASDLHDEVGSLLTQISVNADSLSYTKDEEKIKEKTSFINQKASELISMMSDVIWSIDSRNDNLESLVDRIHNFAQKFLEQHEIQLLFTSEIKDLNKNLKIDFRQNVMMIAKEAINNAVKYSGCTKINVYLKYETDKFELILADNGKGINFENPKSGNGLKNMKMRAKNIDAEIELKNENGLKIHLIKSKF